MAKDIEAVLVQNLQRFITAKGYSSIEKFAYEHGFSKGGLGKILQGKRIPRFDTVVRLAKALEITLHELYPLGNESKNEYSISKRLNLEKIKTARELLSDVLQDREGSTKKKKR